MSMIDLRGYCIYIIESYPLRLSTSLHKERERSRYMDNRDESS